MGVSNLNLENGWASPNNSQVSKCPGTEVTPDCVKEIVRGQSWTVYLCEVFCSALSHTQHKQQVWNLEMGHVNFHRVFPADVTGQKVFFFVCHDWIPTIGWITIRRSPQAAFSHWHAAICQGLSQPRNRGWSQSTRAGKRDMKTKDLVETQ